MQKAVKNLSSGIVISLSLWRKWAQILRRENKTLDFLDCDARNEPVYLVASGLLENSSPLMRA